MRCFLTVAAPRACTPLPLIALVTSCRLARCWLYTREPEAAAASDRAQEAWKVGFADMPPGPAAQPSGAAHAPASNAMQGGEILPEPQHEADWLARHRGPEGARLAGLK